jgi:putative ABC transport system permease protein
MAQVALAVVLLTGAGLLARSLVALLTQDPGFRTEGVLTASLPLGASERAAGERRQPFLGQVLDRVAAVPGVEAAALVNHLPIGGDLWNGDVEVAGRPELDPPPKAVLRTVTPGYFETLGIRRVAGRGFDGSERPDGEPVVVVNQALAELFPGGSDPIGARIRFAFSGPEDPWRRVVGVVGDARQDRLHEPVRPEVYFPYPQDPFPWFAETTLVARTAAEPREALPAVQEAVWAVDPAVPVVRARSLEEVLAEDLAAARFLAALMAAFAATAMALAAVGLFGLLSFLAGRRRREIGVRMALGATPWQVVRPLLAEHGGIVVLGLLAGTAAALPATRLLGTMLYGIPPTDAATYALVMLLVAGVAVFASVLPASRGLRVDPVTALRQD